MILLQLKIQLLMVQDMGAVLAVQVSVMELVQEDVVLHVTLLVL